MILTGKLDLVANRGTPFVHVIDFVGYDLTAATFVATVKDVPDALGSSLIALTNNANPNAEGISVATRVEEDVTISAVQLRINETTIEGIYPPGIGDQAIGSDITLYWGLHITSSGMGKVRWLEGGFTIHAGDQG